jgi:hypothetical protein
MTFLKDILRTVRSNLSAYLIIMAFTYGAHVAGVVYSTTHPSERAALGRRISSDAAMGTDGMFRGMVGRNYAVLVGIIFAHNFQATFVDMLLPSLILPGYGVTSYIRASYHGGVVYGLPLSTNIQTVSVVLLEGQAYIIAMLAVYVYGSRLIVPKLFGLSGYKEGIVVALKSYWRLILFVPVILFVAALYEAWVLTDRIPPNPFPSNYDASFTSHFRQYVSVERQGMLISYDSACVGINDVKIAGAALHDVGYFGPLFVSKDSLKVSIDISLPQTLWRDPGVIRRLQSAATMLKEPFADRHYQFSASAVDSLGEWRKAVMIKP